jgi:hypothetical protein
MGDRRRKIERRSIGTERRVPLLRTPGVCLLGTSIDTAGAVGRLKPIVGAMVVAKGSATADLRPSFEGHLKPGRWAGGVSEVLVARTVGMRKISAYNIAAMEHTQYTAWKNSGYERSGAFLWSLYGYVRSLSQASQGEMSFGALHVPRRHLFCAPSSSSS